MVKVASSHTPGNKSRRVLIIAAVVLVVALGAGLGTYFGLKKTSSSSSSSSPSSNSTTTPSGAKRFIGYFGQNAANNRLDVRLGMGQRNVTTALNQLSLDQYCNTKYYDTINLAFLTEFGGGDNHFTINLATYGLYKWDGTQQTSGFESMIAVGNSIKICQAAGVKIIISLGGDMVSNYSFAVGDGKRYANLFYNAFLGGPNTAVKPFGPDVVLDGIELDIEKNPMDVVNATNPTPSGWTNEMVDFVTTIKTLKPSAIVAAVPQCSLAVPGYLGKDKNMGDLLAQIPKSFDYIIVQYYNNIECTYPFGFNYDAWKTLFPGQILLGLPGDWTSAISGGFLEPPALQAVYDQVKDDKQFGGISVYDVSSSNPPGLAFNATNYANPPVSHYSETIYNLLKGKIVGSGALAQGLPLTETNFAYRCGGSWVYANSNCSLKACNPYLSTNNTIVNGTNVGTGLYETPMAHELQEVKLDSSPAIETNSPVTSVNNKKRNIVIGAAAAIVVIAAGLGGYFATRKSGSSSDSGSSNSVKPTSTGALPPATGGSNIPKITNTLIGYWGQNAANNQLDLIKGWGLRPANAALNQKSLASYCDLGLYQTINLAFLSEFGGPDGHFTINFAANGLYKWDGTKQTSGYDSMDKVGIDILRCQAAGVKILISLGGDKISNYSFGPGDGKKYANIFYNAFLGGSDATVKPFGANVVLDGIELDIEKNPSDVTPTADPTAWTPEMVDFVHTIRQLAPKTIIAAVPQCSLAVPGYLGKDRNMGDLLAKTPESFNYIIVQYYNNIECTYPFGFNYNTWKGLFPGYIYVGLPGDWTSAISGGFLPPNSLQAVYDSIKADNQFAGISVYDVSSSNAPGLEFTAANAAGTNQPVSTYSTTLRNLLDGKVVGSGKPAPGAPFTETDYAYRCGGSWVYANATCSNKVCNPYQPVTGCGPTEQCFRFLSTTC
ncbi:UNVERIFIED_CONTAM: hypothetical protein HDU68_006089 [Siphonaria sp. JEL0065]|nr:hypothetical protein HDU68_006089 [Siphonaria sp. JEL0065]